MAAWLQDSYFCDYCDSVFTRGKNIPTSSLWYCDPSFRSRFLVHLKRCHSELLIEGKPYPSSDVFGDRIYCANRTVSGRVCRNTDPDVVKERVLLSKRKWHESICNNDPTYKKARLIESATRYRQKKAEKLFPLPVKDDPKLVSTSSIIIDPILMPCYEKFKTGDRNWFFFRPMAEKRKAEKFIKSLCRIFHPDKVSTADKTDATRIIKILNECRENVCKDSTLFCKLRVSYEKLFTIIDDYNSAVNERIRNTIAFNETIESRFIKTLEERKNQRNEYVATHMLKYRKKHEVSPDSLTVSLLANIRS